MVIFAPEEKIEIDKLIPYDKNVKEHPTEQVEDIAKLIENPNIGWLDAIVIDENNKIWAGHGRLAVAKKLGLKEVPCKRISGTEEEKKMFMLAHNKTNESAWNVENVKMLLDELPAMKLEEFNFDFGELLEKSNAPSEQDWQEYFSKEDTSQFENLRQITFSLDKNDVVRLNEVLKAVGGSPSEAIMVLVNSWVTSHAS
jgi:hypothetical protein